VLLIVLPPLLEPLPSPTEGELLAAQPAANSAKIQVGAKPGKRPLLSSMGHSFR
jgi:hypothetical protein